MKFICPIISFFLLVSCSENKNNNSTNDSGDGPTIFRVSPTINLKPRSKEELNKYTLTEIHPEMDRLRKICDDKSTPSSERNVAHEEWMMLSGFIYEKVDQKEKEDLAKIKSGEYKDLGNGSYQTPEGVLLLPGGSFEIPIKLEQPNISLGNSGGLFDDVNTNQFVDNIAGSGTLIYDSTIYNTSAIANVAYIYTVYMTEKEKKEYDEWKKSKK